MCGGYLWPVFLNFYGFERREYQEITPPVKGGEEGSVKLLMSKKNLVLKCF